MYAVTMTSTARPTGTDLAALLAVGALWGASFLFIRVAVSDLRPVALIEARTLLAGVALLAVLSWWHRTPDWRADWRGYLLLGALSAAAPFTLIAFAEVRLTASLAAVLNATTPLFALLLGAARHHEPLTRRRLGGVVLGIAGVAVLVGLGRLHLDAALTLAVAASLLAAALYAAGGVYARTRFTGTPPITVATGQQLAAAALLLPSPGCYHPHDRSAWKTPGLSSLSRWPAPRSGSGCSTACSAVSDPPAPCR